MRFIKIFSLGMVLALPVGLGCSSSSGGKADGGAGHLGTGGHGGTGGVAGAGGSGGGEGGAGGAAGSTVGTDGGAGSGGAVGTDGGDGPAGPLEFTDFVKDLIQNKTANTTPVTLDDKTFKDSMNPAAFDGFFP